MIIIHRRPDDRWFSHLYTREAWTRLYEWELLTSSCSSMQNIITRRIDLFLMKGSISNSVISCPEKLRRTAASCANESHCVHLGMMFNLLFTTCNAKWASITHCHLICRPEPPEKYVDNEDTTCFQGEWCFSMILISSPCYTACDEFFSMSLPTSIDLYQWAPNHKSRCKWGLSTVRFRRQRLSR